MANNTKRRKPAAQNIKSRAGTFFTNRKRLVLAVILLAVIGFFVYRHFKGASAKPTYQTAQAQKGTLVTSVSASGQVLTTNIVNVSTSASGVVSDVFVKDGESVSQGQKIAQITLDSSGQQQYELAWSSYLSAKNSLDSANISLYTLQSDMFSKWNTFNNLATSGKYQNSDGTPRNDQRTLPEFIQAQDDWLAAEAKYKQQQSVISQAEADLNSKATALSEASPQITAPIAGIVSNVGIVTNMTLGSQGSSVSVGTGGSVSSNSNTQSVAVIQNPSLPVATFNVSETDIGSIKTGEDATITIDALSGKTFTGKVATVDRIGAVTSGVTNYKVLITFDTDATGVLPNMAASAKIITNVKNDVVLVPSAAVSTTGGQDTVRVMQNGNPVPVNVEIGDSNDSQTEIKSGINDGDTVVVGQSTTPAPGQSGAAGRTSPFGGGGGGRVLFGGGAGGGR